MKRIRSVAHIRDDYSRRILSNILGLDAFRVYSQTPKRIKDLVKGLSSAQLRHSVKRGKWSVSQIISHLCDSELVMGFRYRMALAQTGSRLQAFDERKWADRLKYASSDARKRLELFITLRRDHVTLLRTISGGEWKCYGMHEERGKETVERMVQMMAGHDINHLRQIREIRRRLHRR